MTIGVDLKRMVDDQVDRNLWIDRTWIFAQLSQSLTQGGSVANL